MSTTTPPEAQPPFRCSYCLNSPATNEVQIKNVNNEQGTAYLCDDCHKLNAYPKFTSSYDATTKKITEVEISQDEVNNPKPKPKQAETETQTTPTT